MLDSSNSSSATITSKHIQERKRKKTKRCLDKEAAELVIIKRRRLHSAFSDSAPKRSWKEIADAEFNDYITVIENGHFKCDVDCVVFWLLNATRFPILNKIAFNFLSIPETSTSVERLFSAAGLRASGKRTSLGQVLLEAEVLAKFNRKHLKL